MGEPQERYLNKLRAWLGHDRYAESFSGELDRTKARIGNELPDPEKDPIKTYKEFTQRLSQPNKANISVEGIMSTIDLSVLNPTWNTKKFNEEMEIAKKFGVASVCIYGSRVKDAVEALKDTNIAVAAAIDFDKGQATFAQKANQAAEALEAGATEIDMPINLGRLFSGEEEYVSKELEAAWDACYLHGAIFKPIANVDSMDTEWQKDKKGHISGGDNPFIVKYCELVKRLLAKEEVGYHQIMFKTSTGFDFQTVDAAGNKNYQGALVPGALRTFKDQAQGTNIGIKAAGKVRSGQDFVSNAEQWGVVRYGCTTTPKIHNDLVQMEYKPQRHTAQKQR